jgi:hypothetical protein
LRESEYSAINRIELSTSVDKNEIITEYLNYKIITKNYFKNEYLAKHFYAWFEESVSNHSGISLYTEMELCDKTLKKVINEFNDESHLKTNGMLAIVGYYIASKVFLQILEGISKILLSFIET